MDDHIYDNGYRKDKQSKKDIYSNLKYMEHLYNGSNTIILATIIKELLIYRSLIVLEYITESPYIDIERVIEVDIYIREAYAIGKRVSIFLDESSQIWITSSQEDKSVFSWDIINLYTRERIGNSRQELNRADLCIIIAILEIDTDGYPIIYTHDKPICREYNKEKNMNKEN